MPKKMLALSVRAYSYGSQTTKDYLPLSYQVLSAEIIAASSPGPAIGRRDFGVALSSTDDLLIKKACFADQISGSFVKGVPFT